MSSAAIAASIIANINAEQEQERYDNDPAYRMAVLEDSERRMRKKIRHDIDRIHNPSWFACCRDHEKALAKHKQALRNIKEAEAATRPAFAKSGEARGVLKTIANATRLVA